MNFIIAAITSLLLSFPVISGSAQATDDTKTLHRGNSTEPATLDPHQSEDVSSGNILRDLFEGLVSENAAGNIIPGAAEKWTISEDGRTYTFSLRNSLAWSNGEALTAADFMFSLQRALDPQTAAPMASLLQPIENAREVLTGNKPVETLGIQMPDSHTLVIRLQQPTPWFLQLLAQPVAFPVYASSLVKHGDKAFSTGKLVSNGAWKLQQWVPYEKLVLARNTKYYNHEQSYFEQVI